MIFVRHGETAHNVGLVITSALPGAPLNCQGEAQVRRLAETIATTAVDAIYSSPMVRARQTAAILAGTFGLAPIFHDDLRECCVGELEGRVDPAAFTRLDSTWDNWYLNEDLNYQLGPGGESGTAALARIRSLVENIQRARPKTTVMVVSHGILLQLAVTCLSKNLTRASGHRRWIANAGTVVTEVDDTGMTCLEWSGEPISSHSRISA